MGFRWYLLGDADVGGEAREVGVRDDQRHAVVRRQLQLRRHCSLRASAVAVVGVGAAAAADPCE
jgi:hypothetical protein